MEKKRRAQISVEYLMIFGMTMLILVPTIILFKNFAFSSGDEVVSQRIKEVSLKIVDTAREVHYYGPPSKKILTFDLPPNILSMGIMTTVTGEHVLAFEVVSSDGNYNLYYDSEIPIYVEEPKACRTQASLHSDCGGTLLCDCLEEKEFSQGIRHFNVESTNDDTICQGEDFCVMINEVSDELS